MKAINIFFILLFFASALLQINDPDPLLWILIYLYGATLCYMAFRKQYIPVLFISGIIFYSVYALYIFFRADGVLSWINDHDGDDILQTMKAANPWIENTREFFGLVLLIVALGINTAYFKNINTKKTEISV